MTVPYEAGTVSVTAGSAVVTGVGTAWQTALVAGGLFGLDSANGNPVPIESVDSNTEITLAKPWRGASASGQAYWIMRDTAYGQQTVANANALAQIIADLRSAALAAFAGLAPAADRLPYFSSSGAAAITAFTEFARELVSNTSGAGVYADLGEVPNGQLPSRLQASGQAVDNLNDAMSSGFFVAGLTAQNTPSGNARWLVINQRYSADIVIQIASHYNNTARIYQRIFSGGSWTPWSLVSIPILGSVGISGGIPTGALIENGSNSNGDYVRFADGTQICTATIVPQLAGTAGYYLRNYPASFVSRPVGSWSADQSQAGANISSLQNGYVSVTTSAWAWYRAGGGVGEVNVQLTAIGRWF